MNQKKISFVSWLIKQTMKLFANYTNPLSKFHLKLVLLLISQTRWWLTKTYLVKAKIIKKEGITPANTICTLRVARYLDKNNIIPQYKLQFLRYYLDIDIEGAQAHDALGDVLVLEKLFERLLTKTKEEYNLNDDEALEKMIEISSK